MSDQRQQIDRMQSAGKITQEEAQRLRSALNKSGSAQPRAAQPSTPRWLIWTLLLASCTGAFINALFSVLLLTPPSLSTGIECALKSFIFLGISFGYVFGLRRLYQGHAYAVSSIVASAFLVLIQLSGFNSDDTPNLRSILLNWPAMIVATLAAYAFFFQLWIIRRLRKACKSPDNVPPAPDPFTTPPRLSRLAVAGALGLPAAVIAALLMVALANAFGAKGLQANDAVVLAGCAVLFAGVVLSISALVAIRNSHGRLTGRGLALFGIIAPILLVLVLLVDFVPSKDRSGSIPVPVTDQPSAPASTPDSP